MQGVPHRISGTTEPTDVDFRYEMIVRRLQLGNQHMSNPTRSRSGRG